VHRRRDSNPGFRTELENLVGDGKGNGTSGGPARPKYGCADSRGGLLRSSEEVDVMSMERRGQVIHVGTVRANWKQEELVGYDGGASALIEWHEPCDWRQSSTDL